MLSKTKRALAATIAGAIALTAVSVTPASARRYNAAGAAAFAAVLGTVASVIIAEQRRRDWEARQRAYYGYGYYGYGNPPPPPAAYLPDPAVNGRYWRHRRY